jgi:Domain of unknown function (DUF4124)
MKRLCATLILLFGFCVSANADIWKWVDASGKTHFVDTMTPIYTWVDESGKIHYSDKPEHVDAVSVMLVWHSIGTLDVVDDSSAAGDSESGGYAYPGETAEERAQREEAEAYYCKRADEIYESYVNAPQLYRTNEEGDREYLSKKDAAATIAETKAKRDALCS